MPIAVFEDEYYVYFNPLTLTRPAYMLLCGPKTILENIITHFQPVENVYLFTRPYLAEILSEKLPNYRVNSFQPLDGEVILLNGLLLPDRQLLGEISALMRGECLVRDGRVLAARLKSDIFSNLGMLDSQNILRICNRTSATSAGRLLKYPWELIEVGPGLIGDMGEAGVFGEVDPMVRVYGDRGMLYVGKDAVVEYGCILDTRPGPIHIGGGTLVKAFTRIEGPAWIGRNCIVESCVLKGGVILGDFCRVGGEIESSIIQGYTNKRHLGYLGHSYLGEWVNIGAGTNVSNLKNTYGTHRISLGSGKVDTGRIFLGCFLGDHVKTGIGTLIMGARRVGVSSHIYGEVVEDVPSYTAYSRAGKVEIDLDSAIRNAGRMMGRRGVELTPAYERMMRTLYELTMGERTEASVSKGVYRL